MYQIKLEKFEGPLGLLLQLIEKEELVITEISLSQVTEAYLAYLRESDEIPEEELVDFLVIAAKLLLIKSRSLLPGLGTEEEGLSLVDQLKMYKEFVEAAKRIEEIIKKKHFAYFRVAPLKPGGIGFFPPRGLKISKMQRMFAEILEGIRPFLELPQATLEKSVSIKEKIKQIQDLLAQSPQVNFKQLLKNVKTRTEMVVSFLALLELMKQRSVAVRQEEIFEEIIIEAKKTPNIRQLTPR